MHKIIIAGSRDFQFCDVMDFYVQAVIKNLKEDTIEIVSGTARGADKLGEQFSAHYDYQLKRMPANWNEYGKSAGYRRNKEMAEYANVAILFWDGESKGTRHMIDLAESHNLATYVFKYSFSCTHTPRY